MKWSFLIASGIAASLFAVQAIGAVGVGTAAPDFSLTDSNGKTQTLSQYRGKTVVLEWNNPGCPFVHKHYESGNIPAQQAKATASGVVWLTINSNGPGKEGYGVDNNKAGMATFHMVNPVLLDADGKVGHAYGARTTPHMFVIDASGTLVYRGAIDNAQDGEPEQGAPFVNYVDNALQDLSAKRPLRTADTKSYGCSVKYVP